MLTIWQWETESMGLHGKAFGQDVWSIKFSKYNSKRLATSGHGHIKFWSISSTFTGKKLQGNIGKFGKIDISDIRHFVELPDGKVITGTKSGNLLLWEGNFIKCQLVLYNDAPCHNDEINFIDFYPEDKVIVTSSLDGVIKIWEFNAIDNAEVDSDITLNFNIIPLAEYSIRPTTSFSIKESNEKLGVVCMVDSNNLNENIRRFVYLNNFGQFSYVDFSLLPINGDLSTPRSLSQVFHALEERSNYSFKLNNNIIEDPGTTREDTELQNPSEPTVESSTEPTVESNTEPISEPTTEPTAEPAAISGSEHTELLTEDNLLDNINPTQTSGVAEEFMVSNQIINTFHFGSINAFDNCPVDHLIATAGTDGTIRCIDYVNHTILTSIQFSMQITSLKWIDTSIEPTGKTIIAGFEDGTVRIFTLGYKQIGDTPLDETKKLEWIMRAAFKPHVLPVINISFSSNNIFSTSGKDGIIFFFKIDNIDSLEHKVNYLPIRFLNLTAAGNSTSNKFQLVANNVDWDKSNNFILVSCNDNIVREFDVSSLLNFKDYAEKEGNTSYEAQFPYQVISNELFVLNNPATNILNVLTDEEANTILNPVKDTTEGAEGAENTPEIETKKLHNTKVEEVEQNLPYKLNVKTNFLIYSKAVQEDQLGSISSSFFSNSTKSFIGSGFLNNSQNTLFQSNIIEVPISLFELEKQQKELEEKEKLIREQLDQELSEQDQGKQLEENQDTPKIVKTKTQSELAPVKLCEKKTKLKMLPSGITHYESKEFSRPSLVTEIKFSKTGRYILIGFANGQVQLRPVDSLELFLSSSHHNTYSGGVKSLSCSFDDRYIFSIGYDGCLVIKKVCLNIVEEKSPLILQDANNIIFNNSIQNNNDNANNFEINNFSLSKKIDYTDKNYVQVTSNVINTREDLAFFNLFQERDQDQHPKCVIDSVMFIVKSDLEDVPKDAYSIQDSKLKQEEDHKKIIANEVKNRVLASVRSLRKDYEKLIKENNSIPIQVRLPFEQVMLDKAYFDMLENQGKEMIEEIHKEYAFSNEKSELLIEKLKSRLLKNLLIEEMPLAALDHITYNNEGIPTRTRNRSTKVFSLRTAAIDPIVVRIVSQVKAQIRQQELNLSQQNANKLAQSKSTELIEELKLKNKDNEENGDENANNHSVAKFGESSNSVVRSQMRKDRKENLSKHLEQKPGNEDDDQRDLDAIQHAEKTIGDYKLKCSDDYEVPSDHRMNVDKKVKQMAMLEDSMFALRVQYNERFLALRELKRHLIFSIKYDNQRIREIDTELSQTHLSNHLWEPNLDPDEFPEDYEEVTMEELEKYREFNLKNEWKNSVPVPHSIIKGDKICIKKQGKLTDALEVVRVTKESTPIGDSYKDDIPNFLSDPSKNNEIPERIDSLRPYEVDECLLNIHTSPINFLNSEEVPMSSVIEKKNIENSIPLLKFTKDLLKSRMLNSQTDVQKKINHQRRLSLEFERKSILKRMEENINEFKEAIEELQVDRTQVLCDLKLAEYKLLTHYEEFKLLETFENRDVSLQQKQARCKAEEAEVHSLSYETRMKLASKTEESLHWQDKLKQIAAEFELMKGENNQFGDTLTKIFKKKIKRNKHNDGDDGDNEDDYESEDDDEDEDEDDDDGEEIEDICPPGCDQLLFEKVLDLREKKLDTEEVYNDIQKNIDELKKTTERLKQREKQIMKETQQTELEMQQFQSQKQAALNQIEIIVPLRLSQVYTFNCSGILTGPHDVDSLVKLSDEEIEQYTKIINDVENRSLVTDISLKSHSLFSSKCFNTLKNRIVELHKEIEDSKSNFKDLHRDRLDFLKRKEFLESETELWRKKCHDLQMLKFGREIDLDELELYSDRTKEREVEASLDDGRLRFEKESNILVQKVNMAQERLMQVTKNSTKLLEEVAKLSEAKLRLTRELNQPGRTIAPTNTLDDIKALEEKNRIKNYVQFQATELQALRTELNMLKRKEAPIFNYSSPPNPPQNLMSQTAPLPHRELENLTLPPIPTKKS